MLLLFFKFFTLNNTEFVEDNTEFPKVREAMESKQK